MATGERAFARHISRQSAAEVRQEASSAFKEELDSSLRTLESILQQSDTLFTTSPNTLMEPETPLDYEKYLEEHQSTINGDPLRDMLLFPDDDVQVTLVKRQFKTTEIPVPAAARRCEDPLVKQCVASFTADWNVVERRYGAFHGQDQRTLQRRFASLRRTASGVKLLPSQDYEVDMQEDTTDTASVGSIASIGSAYDLESSESDALLYDLLTPPQDDRAMDETNRMARKEKRFSSLFSLCQLPDREELIETRQPAPIPDEPEGLKVLIKVSELKLEPTFEPIFAVLALYDAREKKKISESFHMDMNSSEIHHMLDDHVHERNIGTLGRSAIFTITNPHKDIFLIVKLEKVLQKGDIVEAAEPYHRDMDRKTEEKIRSNAAQVCRQLGQYRMPLAWAPVNIIEIISNNSGSSAIAVSAGAPEGQLEKRESYTSLGDRRLSESRKKDPKGSLTGKSALTLSGEYAKEEALNISSSFAPVTLTVNAFFRQEGDKIHDDNLYRYLSELQKQPASLHRKLKSIPATLKLDISPPYDNMPCCLTSSLWQIKPYPEANRRPTKEVEEFIPRELFAPDTSYKNFLYVYAHSLDMKSQSKGQNLGVKLQFMAGEDPQADALQMIYGRSSGPRFVREYWCPIIYHNKTPEFYDEIKIELPPRLTDKHHLLFSFYHISCKKPKPNEEKQEPVYIGCTWVPLYTDGVPPVGPHDLPVLVETPPHHYSAVPAEGNNLPALKWMDGHRPLFRVTIAMESSVHPQDRHIMKFLRKFHEVQEVYDDGDVKGLIDAMQTITSASSKALVKFLHIILDNLLTLVVWPAVTEDGKVVSQKAFMALAKTVHVVHSLGLSVDKHGRNIILASFIQHVMQAPVGSFGPSARDRRTTMLADARMVFEDDIEEKRRPNTMRGPPSSKMAAGPAQDSVHSSKKMLHEEIAWAWVLNHQDARHRKTILTNAWFLFDIMVKGMAQYLEVSGQFILPRKDRFPENFLRDLEILVEQLTQEISETHIRDGEYATNLNIYLAFFVHDAFSLLDRGFVFGLLRVYLKKLSLSTIDYNLTELKIQFLRIVCNHEHYIPLNLPLRPSLAPAVPDETPSPVGSLGSGLDELGLSPMDAIAELSPDFRQHHYLSGLLLSELSVILNSKGNKIREPAIEMLRDLLAAHDNDVRYGTAAARSRIATMYFPLLSIVMQHSSILFKDSAPSSDTGGLFDRTGDYRRSVIIRDEDKFGEDTDGQSSVLGQNATHSLLSCFLWVLKNLEVDLLRQWWTQLKISDINELLNVLEICVQTFEYKGRKAYMAALANSGVQTVTPVMNVKEQLALAILGGQGTATQMLRDRRRNMTAVNQPKGTDSMSLKKRWCKSYYAQSSETSDKPKVDANIDVFIESSLSAECSLVILDTVEELIQTVSTRDTLSSCLGGCLGVLLQLMNATQSNEVYHHIFATQRAVVFKYPELLFEEEIEQCAELCACLLRHCGSKMPEIRALACTSLYQLMKENYEMGTTGNNFARVKVQVTIALSSIVTSRLRFNEVFLRRSFKTLLMYAANESGDLADSTFPDQVRVLAHNLNEILSNTMKLQQYEDDMETYMDLMYSIAKGYQNSPDLRLQWLQHMAEKHVQHKNYAEAAMCITHTVALVAEYLYILERKSYLPVGCVSFQRLSPNMLEESAISDDIISPEEEGLCSHKFFSEFGFMGLMEYAAQLFNEAKMYEAMSEVYKLVMPIHESRRAFDKLEKIHGKLQAGYQRIVAKGDKRSLGSFFRVGFYGSLFNELDNLEFIYKEEGHTRLAEFSLRLERQYSSRVGENNLVILKDSNRVSVEKLDPTKAYIQITFTEPYFNDYEMSDRVTTYDRTVNVRRFAFRTPFTEAGKAHGSLENQFMRRTIVTTQHHFPYVKTRVLVVASEEEVLSPLECAIANMQDKTKSLQQALHQVPVDMKFLQMQLQGGIATSVNQGPYAIAKIFLGNVPPADHTHLHQKLKVCFKEFCKLCQDALVKNKSLISEEQFEYQREMERNFHEFAKSMDPMLKHRKKHHYNPRRQRDGSRVLDRIARTSQGYSED